MSLPTCPEPAPLEVGILLAEPQRSANAQQLRGMVAAAAFEGVLLQRSEKRHERSLDMSYVAFELVATPSTQP